MTVVGVFTIEDLLMPLIFMFLIALLGAVIIYNLRPSNLPRAGIGWGAGKNDDPRVAAAAMMVAVATEHQRLSPQDEMQILDQLVSTMGLTPELARDCLKLGRRHARINGDLTARLHQLKSPIARTCSLQEKQDVITMLRKVAGPNADRVGSVRDGIGRLAGTLMEG
jgi:uncharacterized tellurite resistance protein B-like protein